MLDYTVSLKDFWIHLVQKVGFKICKPQMNWVCLVCTTEPEYPATWINANASLGRTQTLGDSHLHQAFSNIDQSMILTIIVVLFELKVSFNDAMTEKQRWHCFYLGVHLTKKKEAPCQHSCQKCFIVVLLFPWKNIDAEGDPELKLGKTQ